MAITLKNYPVALPPDLLLQAKKNKVRECDEAQKGYFIAYVDDGNESFDVSLTIGASNEITQHTCECGSINGICRHKAALIVHIAEGKKANVVVKVKKKENKAEALLEDIDPNALKEWVKGLISKNKDIELSFLNYFSIKEQRTPAEVAKMINDAVKAVAGNKKTIDLTQLKKIVELWTEVVAPVAEDYQANVTNEKSFLNFHTVLETCMDFQFRIDSTSNRIPKFVEQALQKTVEAIGNLQVEETWDKAVSYFVNHVPDGLNRVRMHYLFHLKNIISISSEDRKLKIIDSLAKQFGKSKPETLMNGTPYCKFVFDLIDENGLFLKYSDLFKPIRFDNDYNRKLIRLLIDNNNLEQAKKYCAEQLKYNFREDYNVLYWMFLKEIHLIEKDEKELVRVLTLLVPLTLNFDDYLFVSGRLPEEERKKWRTKMLTKSRHMSAPYRKSAEIFAFKLADYEKNYRKMIEYIDSTTPYDIILQYFERMVLADKNKLLETIFSKTDDYGWNVGSEKEKEDVACFPELLKLFEKHYTPEFLKLAIRNSEVDRRYYRPGGFVAYVTQQRSI